MHQRLAVTFVLALLAAPAVGLAQSAQLPQLDEVKPGLPVSVIDDEGRRVDGRVIDVSDDAIRVSVRKRTEQIPIGRVVRIDKTDSLKNGALGGLVAGLGFGIFVAAHGQADRPFLFAAAVSNGLIWTAFGVGIDAMVDSRRTLYRRSGGTQARVSPLVGREVRGAAVSVSW
jgi:hypothetical protein